MNNIILLTTLSLLALSCQKDIDKTTSNNYNILEIEQLKAKFSKEVIRAPLALSAPIIVGANNTSLLLYDYGDFKVKLISKNNAYEFYAAGSANNIQGGAYIQSFGYSLRSPNKVLVGSEKNIRSFDLLSEVFLNDIDTYQNCSSFNKLESEIFEIIHKKDTILISQNGIPCINAPRGGAPYSLEEFKSINFLRVYNRSKNKFNYTFSIPQDNEIITKNKLYVKTYPLIDYNEEEEAFYCLINPTKQLLKYKLDGESLTFQLIERWNLDLPYFDQQIEYTLNKGMDRRSSQLNLKYNPEFKILKVVNGKMVVMYRPGIKKMDYEHSKYTEHYFLYIYDIKKNQSITYALNYGKIFFLNMLENGDLWFENTEASEMSNSVETIINKVNVNDLF